MTEPNSLERENSYLKGRVADLQADVVDLNAEINRLRQQLEVRASRQEHTPNPLGSGQ